MEDKKKIEAVLFAVGDKIEEDELSRLTRLDIALVKNILAELREDYRSKESTFILLNEGTKWKLTVREDYMPLVQRIVPKTELPRPVLETLAVVAWKSPVLQSDIIDIRSTKAYDHIEELVNVGFITKTRYGRSFMLKLSQQFFEYFDIKNKEEVKEIFKGIAVEPKPKEQKELSEVIPKADATKDNDSDIPAAGADK
jgi:segregation and condensation protein B